ncbi:MAG: lysylphosphatidylglycerol synthase transmembrane domain-containing protein [candidate division WOR-3 bacterium]
MENFKKYVKFFKLFIIAYVIVSFGFVLFFSGRDFLKVIFHINVFYFLIGIIIWILFIVLDGFRLLIISKGIGKSLSLKISIEFITSGSFFALTTPFGGGGLIYQAWLLKKYNFSLNQTLSLIISRGFCIFIPYLTFLPFVISSVKSNLLKIFVIYAFLIAFIFFLVLIFKKEYRERLKEINWKFLILAILISFPIQVIYLSFLYISLKTLSINSNFIDTLLRQVIMQLSTYFQITPGGLGISELISSIIIFENLDFKYIGFSIVLWRFFSGYLSGFMGFFFIINRLKAPTQGAN